jgi:GNAT superfamily N-acetyltransferase
MAERENTLNALEQSVLYWRSSTKADFERKTFHLPGGHDQQSHAGGGAGGDPPLGHSFIESARDLHDSELQEMEESVLGWDGTARSIGRGAISYFKNTPDHDELDLVRTTDEKGKTTGVMALGNSNDLINDYGGKIDPEDYLEVHYLAAGVQGQRIGTKLLEAAFERAEQMNRGIILYSVSEAREFYQKLEGVDIGESVFYWPPEKVREMLDKKVN